MNGPQSIGETLKEIRTRNGYSLRTLADELNEKYVGLMKFNRGNMSRWENGKEEPKLSTIRVVADFYEICIDDLANGRVEPNNKTMCSLYKQLEESKQNKVYSYAEHQLEEQNNNEDVLIAAHMEDDLSVDDQQKVNEFIDKLKKEHNEKGD